MKPPSSEKNLKIPDDIERAQFWANLLNRSIGSHEIYFLAKANLDPNRRNPIKNQGARDILETAIKRFEEIWGL